MTADETEAAARAQPGETRSRRLGLFVSVAALALALDVSSKLIVVAKLPESHAPVRILGGAIYLQQTRNSGAAFSLGTGFTVVLTLVAVAVVGVIARTAGRMRSRGWAIALGLILGGALGNLADRIFRAPGVGSGHVVDWISAFGPDAKYWPIFNLADSAIVCGAILAALLALLGIDLDGQRARSRNE
ncbi:MAG TPA: signal peptidase II [Jatrophihabitans sp.]|nr:signal peptidase II [Jatrophihabitans sp.]